MLRPQELYYLSHLFPPSSILVSSCGDSHSSNGSSGGAGIEPWTLNLQAKGSDHSASTQAFVASCHSVVSRGFEFIM